MAARYTTIFILLFLSEGSAQDLPKESEIAPLRIGFQNSPPYQIVNEDGTLGGIAIELLREAAARRNIELEWVHRPSSPDESFANNTVDLWPVITDLPERRKKIFITKPIYQNSLGVLSLQADPITQPGDTVGKRVAYFDREPSLTLLPKLLPESIKVPMQSHVSAIDSVLTGENDAAFLWSTKSNSVDFKRAIDEHPEVAIHFFTFPGVKLSCGIGADLDNPRAIAAAKELRDEFSSLVQQGIVQGVYFKYYLDPENEISSYFYLEDTKQKAKKLTVVLSVLAAFVVALGVMAFQLRRSRKKADAANQAKGEFLANMSHEFRTPLNGIMGMTQLVMETPVDKYQKELLEVVLESAEALLTIVNDILDLSKIEAGKLNIETEALSLRELLRSTTPFFELVARQKGLVFKTEIAPGCPEHIESDAIRLRQILFNLIGNAVKFTPSGSVSVTIDSLRLPAGDFLLFEVSDTGIGIPDDLLNSIFEAFTQADATSTRNYGGTGLGLTISRHLAKLLGGQIHVESVAKKGSVFSVMIPLVRCDTSTITGTQPTSTDLVSSESLQILVVDDNEINLQTIKAVLNRLDHRVTCSKDGKSAIKLAEKHTYDLILMDLQMPNMDGWETARTIRATETLKSRMPPIVALTASIYSDALIQRAAHEMDGLIFKPFEIRALQEVITRFN